MEQMRGVVFSARLTNAGSCSSSGFRLAVVKVTSAVDLSSIEKKEKEQNRERLLASDQNCNCSTASSQRSVVLAAEEGVVCYWWEGQPVFSTSYCYIFLVLIVNESFPMQNTQIAASR